MDDIDNVKQIVGYLRESKNGSMMRAFKNRNYKVYTEESIFIYDIKQAHSAKARAIKDDDYFKQIGEKINRIGMKQIKEDEHKNNKAEKCIMSIFYVVPDLSDY